MNRELPYQDGITDVYSEVQFMGFFILMGHDVNSVVLNSGFLIIFVLDRLDRDKMNREVPYRDVVANVYADDQLQHLSSQRMHQNAAMDDFHGDREDPYARAQWDRHERRRSPPALSRSYPEARQGGIVDLAIYHAQVADSKLDLEHLRNKGARYQSHEEDMEIGYEDKPSPLTFEVLEHKFQNEILKLIKEQSDAEDAEIIRHRERINEINNMFQEQLAALRARQASRREEFLHNEAEARLRKYEQVVSGNSLTRTGIDDLHEYAGPAAISGQRRYSSRQNDHNSEEPRTYHGVGRNQVTEGRVPYPQIDHNSEDPRPYHGAGRNQETEGRVPYPAGRVYNNARSRYG